MPDKPPHMQSIAATVLHFGRMIKFSHTIFALPFALSSAVMASKFHALTWEKVIWIVFAMIGARSAAMGFNRIADVRYDSKNPRTANREIPRGIVSIFQAWIFVILSSALLVFSSYMLNDLCFKLSPLALFIVFFYSYTKRFTSLAHFFLGIALGVAPLGAWMAIGGEWSWPAFLLGCGVVAWVAGFDIIYACQDYEFDKHQNLFSIPKTFGISASLWISRICHILAVVILLVLGFWLTMSWAYYAGIVLIGLLLLYEQQLVRANDLSKVNMAFFNMNGVISLIYFIATSLDVFVFS